MLLLYAADLSQGGHARMRMEMIRDLGHRVVPFGFGRVGALHGRLSAEMAVRFQFGRAVSRLNDDLVSLARSHHPDVVWIDKGLLVRESTLFGIRSDVGSAFVHYNPDDPFGCHPWRVRLMWRTFVKAISSYDLHFVPRIENIDDYLACGAKQVVRIHRGYHPTLHRRLPTGAWRRPPYASKVCFPGAREQAREAQLSFLAEQGMPLTVWGRTWNSRRRIPSLQSHCILRTPVGEEYVRVINGAGICLNFLRRANRDRENSRTFEITACGAFLLGERNDEQLGLYEEGKEAEFFSCRNELLDKVRFYLADERARQRVADAGHARCLSSGYSYRQRLEEMLSRVKTLL